MSPEREKALRLSAASFRDIRDCMAEIDRLRAENAALQKVIADVAKLNNSDDNGARRETARIIGEVMPPDEAR